jgi:hypothetical protein
VSGSLCSGRGSSSRSAPLDRAIAAALNTVVVRLGHVGRAGAYFNYTTVDEGSHQPVRATKKVTACAATLVLPNLDSIDLALKHAELASDKETRHHQATQKQPNLGRFRRRLVGCEGCLTSTLH